LIHFYKRCSNCLKLFWFKEEKMENGDKSDGFVERTNVK